MVEEIEIIIGDVILNVGEGAALWGGIGGTLTNQADLVAALAEKQTKLLEGAFENGDKTKLDYITVSQSVDLDAMEQRVNQLDQAVVLKGAWDASSGSFPGSGAAQAGEMWYVTVAGTVDGVEFKVNDRIISLIDNSSTSTYANNWFKRDHNDDVLSAAEIETLLDAYYGNTNYRTQRTDASILNITPRVVAMPASEIDLSTGEVFTKTAGTDQQFTIANAILNKSFRLELTGGSLNATLFSGYTANYIAGSADDYNNAVTCILHCEIRSAGQIYVAFEKDYNA